MSEKDPVEVEAEAGASMIRGEVPLDDPDNVDWPDGVPVQSRYGSPDEHCVAQSTAAQQAPVEDEPEAAPPVPAPPAPPREK